MSDLATPAPSPVSLRWREILQAPLLLFAGSLAVVGLVALFLHQSRWSADVGSQTWDAAALNVVTGEATRDRSRLIIQQTGANGSFIATLPSVQLEAEDFGAIEIRMRGVNDEERVAVLWRPKLDAKTHTIVAQSAGDNGVRAYLRSDPGWAGPVTGLGLIVVGPIRTPIIVESVRAVSLSARPTVAETLADWTRFAPWNGQSINVLFLGADFAPLSLPLFVAMACALALAAWILRPRAHRDARRVIAGSAVILACGWVLLDARWLLNLSEQAAETARTFAGKTWPEKRMAAEDRQLYAFIEQAKAAIAPHPGRIFFASDVAYLRARAAYHFLPQNALSIVYHANLHDPRALRPGDYVCVFAYRGIAYDAAAKTLRWGEFPPLRVEPVLASGFGALYRVRA